MMAHEAWWVRQLYRVKNTGYTNIFPVVVLCDEQNLYFVHLLTYKYQQTFFQEWDYALNIWGDVVKAMEGTIANLKKHSPFIGLLIISKNLKLCS